MASRLGSRSITTPAETVVRSAFESGNEVDFNQNGPRLMSRGKPVYDPARVIHASVLQELLLAATNFPPGRTRHLTVTGANIRGPLNLQFAKIDCPIRLEDCWFDSSLVIAEADLRSVSLRGSTVAGSIDARHVRVTGDLMLDGLCVIGPLWLAGAHLEDDLHLSDAKIYQRPSALDPTYRLVPDVPMEGSSSSGQNDEYAALLDLDHAAVRGVVLAERIEVHGGVGMEGTTVGSDIHMKKAVLGDGTDACAWRADRLRVEGDINAELLRATGQVSLIGAQMHTLVLNNLRVESAGRSLMMDRAHCTGSVFCDGDIDLAGGIQAIGAKIGETLYLGRGRVCAPRRDGDDTAWSIKILRAQIGGNLQCATGFTVTGTFDISYSSIGGDVDLRGTTVNSPSSEALGFLAGRTHIGGNLQCAPRARQDGERSEHGFTCQGVLGLVNAQIDGWARIKETPNSDVSPRRGTTLVANEIRVARYLHVDVTGRVNLSGANIAGKLTVNLGGLTASDFTPTADLSGLRAHVLKLEGRQKGCLDLTGASVHQLVDDPSVWRRGKVLSGQFPSLDESQLILDGLVYEEITEASPDDRLAWVDAGTRLKRSIEAENPTSVGTWASCERPNFVPQPYQQLSSLYSSQGRDSEARDVLYAMYCRRNAVLHSGHPLLKAWNGVQRWTLGYGYRPIWAFGWIIGLAAATTLWIVVFDKNRHVGIIPAAIISLGLTLPGSGLDKIEKWQEISPEGHVLAVVLVLAGLTLGATVIAAVARSIKR